MADVTLTATGVSATGSPGQALVYSIIVPDQDPNYTEITP